MRKACIFGKDSGETMNKIACVMVVALGLALS